LLALLEYREAEGRFVWRIDRRSRGKAGETAGFKTVGKGGRVGWAVSVRGKVYTMRALVHFYRHGTWPPSTGRPAQAGAVSTAASFTLRGRGLRGFTSRA